MMQQGWKQKDIALAIGKDKSVVSRELKRNCDNRDRKYKADLAQRKYENRQKNKPKHIRFTEEVKQYVEECLAKDFSPEQIRGRAVVEGRECVSHERIYQYVWKDKKAGGDLIITSGIRDADIENMETPKTVEELLKTESTSVKGRKL